MQISSHILSIVLVPLLIVLPVIAEPAADSVETLQVHAMPGDGSSNPDPSYINQAFSVEVSDQNGAPVTDAAVLLRLPDSGPSGSFRDGTHAAVGYSDATGRARFSGIQWNAEHGTVPVTITATKGAAHAGALLEHVLTPDIPEPAAPTQIELPVQGTVAAPVSQPKAAQPRSPAKEKIEVAVSQPAAVSPVLAATASANPQPGIIARPAAVLPDGASETPSVSIVNGATHEKISSPGGSSHKKWYILAAIIAGGAGAGVAMMGKSSGSSSSSVSAPTISIGAPTVSVGHP
ncbi:MAG TPA: hypothetical protein VH351_19035 [Bryobacteraceae bacterium]|jgi:hypothetical protein|nr:hypothetical protein [Bryobacteraceae bacterium]